MTLLPLCIHEAFSKFYFFLKWQMWCRQSLTPMPGAIYIYIGWFHEWFSFCSLLIIMEVLDIYVVLLLCATCITYSAPWTAAQRRENVCWWGFEPLSSIKVTQPPVTPLSVPSKGDESILLCLTKQNISFHQKVLQSWSNLEFSVVGALVVWFVHCPLD